MYKKILFAALLINISFNLFAQSDFAISKNTGVPFRVVTKDDVAGSPMLYDDWKTGSVIIANNEKYDNVQLKFDAFRNKFIYNQHDTLYEFVSDLTEVRLKDSYSNRAGKEIVFKKYVTGNGEINGFVQELCSGKISVVKEFTKKPEGENSTNGMFESQRKYVLHTRTFAIKDNNLIPVKYSSRSLEDLTEDKKDKVEAYVISNKLNVKSEKDYIAAISFYNSLASK